MNKLTKKNVTVGALLATTALATPAHSQIAPGLAPPPVYPSVDENGVELRTGSVAKVLASISIGPGGPGSLGFDWATDNSKQWPVVGYVHVWTELTGAGYLSHFAVTVGGTTEAFSRLNNGSYTNDQGTPSTFDGSTYTAADGTVAVFGGEIYEGMTGDPGYAIYDMPIAQLTYPTGEKLTYYWSYNYANSANLNAVTSSLGYQLRLTWSSATQVSSAVVFNMNSETCDPTAASCTLTGTWPTLTWDSANSRVVDNTGKWVGYIQTSAQRVITYPSGRTLTYTGTALPNGFQVSSYTDGKGTWNYTQWSDQYGNNVSTVADPEHASDPRRLHWFNGQLTYDKSVQSQGLETDYAWGAHGITKVQKIGGSLTSEIDYGYDARGNRNSVTQISTTPGIPANIVTTAVYPSTCTNVKTCNKPTSVTDARGNTTNYAYDANSGQVATVTLPAPTTGAVQPQTRYTYTQMSANYRNGSGTIISGAPVWRLTATSACQTLSSCAGTSDEVKTSVTYDPNQSLLPVSISKGSGNGSLTATTAMTYTGNGDVNTVDGPLPGNADTSRDYYDTMRRSLGSIGPDPDGAGPMLPRAARITYDNDGRPATTDVGTAVGQGDNDLAGMTSLQQQVTSYDAQGRVASVQANAGGTTYGLTQESYAASGAPTCTAVHMNSATFGSPPADACTLGTQGSYGPDRITSYAHDTYYRTTSVTTAYGTSAAAAEVTNSYDSLGRLASVKDGENNLTTYVYDGMSRLSQAQYPSPTKGAGTSNTSDYEQLTYDANGNVTSKRNRDGTSTTFSYDALNRVTTATVPTSASGTAGYSVYYGYDNRGLETYARFSSMTGSGITNSYDALGRLTSSSTNISGTAQTLSYQYDVAGRRTQLTYPEGFYVNTDYLTTGEVQKIRENGAVSGIGVLATYSYDALGNRSSVAYGNGVVTSYSYDPLSRLKTLTNDLAGTDYDLSIGTSTNPITYNPASEITSVTRTNDTYAWTGAVNVSHAYTSNGPNQYTAAAPASYTYDYNGNLTSDGTNSFAYDAENHLTSAAEGSISATLSYDPAGRLWKIAGSGIADLQFLYDGDQLVSDYVNSTGALYHHYVFGPAVDEPIVEYDSSGVRTWLVADERGSIVARPNDAGNSSPSRTLSYDEYGMAPSANPGRFQYTGQMYLHEIGLSYYKARMYSPVLGRFMQTDPIGYGDGPNWYAYTHNDPVNYTDPLGLCIGGGGYNAGPPTYAITCPRIYNDLANLQGWPQIFQPGDSSAAIRRIVDQAQEKLKNLARRTICPLFTANPHARGTLQLGLAGSGRLPFIKGFGVGGGFAIDRSGTVALYGYWGKLVGTGLGGAAGVSAQISSARGVDGLRGPFVVASATGGDGWAGSADVFADPINRDTAGGGFTLGGGGGYTVNGGMTNTHILKLTNLSKDLGCNNR